MRPRPDRPRRQLAGIAAVVVLAALAAAVADAQRAGERDAMVAVVARHAASLPDALDGRPLDPRVLEAMRATPRHAFVPEDVRAAAYADRPLPIGYGQTISQPFIVALMTHLLDVGPEARVLEVGTGSGYQAAVLSPLVDRVHTIEIVPELGRRAADTLERLGYADVETRVGDGYFGWPEAAPFDAIVVTAAASHVPPPLVEQLRPGARMAIPVGAPFAVQHLLLVEKDAAGEVTTRQLLPVRFVPLTGSR